MNRTSSRRSRRRWITEWARFALRTALAVLVGITFFAWCAVSLMAMLRLASA